MAHRRKQWLLVLCLGVLCLGVLCLGAMGCDAEGEAGARRRETGFFGAAAEASCLRDPRARVTYAVSVLDWDTRGPPEQTLVQACERSDPDCKHPIESYELLESFQPQGIDLPRGFDGLLEFRAPDALPTLLWLPEPLCGNAPAALPVWVFNTASVGTSSQVLGMPGPSSNRLLLQRIACDGWVEPFPLPNRRALVRVSEAGALPGQRSFTSFEGRVLAAAPAPAVFADLPEDQELALEVFDFVDQYQVLQLRVSARQTSIASVPVSNCEGQLYEPH